MIAAILSCFAAVFVSLPTWSQSRVQGLILNAEKSFRDTDNETIELEGKVQVIYQNHHLSADKATLDLRARTVEADGNVLVVTPELTYGGRRIRMDYESNTGFIVDGYVQSRNVLIEGDFLQKIGPKEFLADKARYTTCENCPETWSFSGSRVRAELGGYAFIKNTVLSLGSVPVLWLPYLAVPLQSERQSGLLTPSFANTSDSGSIFSQPFFWAMSRSQDSTWTLSNYEYRGLKLLTNYRYILSEKSFGELDAAGIQDRRFSSSERMNLFRPPTDQNQRITRWFFKYSHFYDLPEGYVNRVQLKNSSDLQYPLDFPRETMTTSEGWLENRVSVTKNSVDQHWSFDSSYYTNLLQSDPLSTNNDSVHRLPDIRWNLAESRMGSSEFFYSANARYTHFVRSGFAYDEMNTRVRDLATDGQRKLNTIGAGANCQNSNWETNQACRYFRTGRYDEEKDLIRTGQRADFNVSVIRPINQRVIDFLPKLSYRETHYLFDVGSQRSNVRRLARAELSARTSFSTLFDGKPDQDELIRYKHEIQPEVTYTTIPWVDHPAHPFWGRLSSAEIPAYLQENISDVDLNSPFGMQFDYEDRLLDRKLLTYGVVNKLVQKRTRPSGESTYAQLVSWRLAQAYDLFQVESQDPTAQPYSDILSELVVSLPNYEIYQKANYYPYQKTTNTSTRVRIFNEKSESISVAHNLSYNVARGRAVDYNAREEDVVLSGKKILSQFDFVLTGTYSLSPSKRIKNYGYAVQYRLPGNCWYVIWSQYQEINGNFGWQVKFDFSWDGKPNASLREDYVVNTGNSSWYTPSAF